MQFLNWINVPLLLTTRQRLIFGILIAVGVCLFFWENLHLQIWNDEVYSLVMFERIPPGRTLTWYPETNNHVLFNFIQNLWIRMLGSPPVNELLAKPWLLRIPLLVYIIVACNTVFHGLMRRFGPAAAMLGLTLLLTSVANYNYALQMRSYGLLIMLGMLQLFGFWGYLERGGPRRLWPQTIWAFILFYAHPAGIYLGIGWILATIICFSGDLRRFDLRRQRAYYVCGAWICGLFLAGLAYLPIIDSMLHNPWIGEKKVTLPDFVRDTGISVLRQLAGNQFWVLALAFFGVVLTRYLKHAPTERRILFYCVAIVFCTYLMPLLRLDAAPQRTFTMLIPYIAVGLCVAIAGMRKALPGLIQPLLPIAVVVALTLQFPFVIRKRNAEIRETIRSGVELSRIDNAYYLHRFNPLDITLKAKRVADSLRLPVYSAIAYRQELPHYLNAFSMPWLEYRSEAQRQATPATALIITSMLPEFRRRYGNEVRCDVVDSSGDFYELLLVRRLAE